MMIALALEIALLFLGSVALLVTAYAPESQRPAADRARGGGS